MADPIPTGGQAARPLPAELAGVVQDMAQALLNLEHALCFYPEGHQARQAPLERLLAMLQSEALISGAAALGFSGELLCWRDGLYTELPAAVRKLATLLGNQGIARLSWSPGLTAAELEEFLSLLARSRSGGHRHAWDAKVLFKNLQVGGLDFRALMSPRGAEGAGTDVDRGSRLKAFLLRALADPSAEPTAEDLNLLRGRWEDPAALAVLLAETNGAGVSAGAPEAVETVRRFAGLVEQAAAAGEPLPQGESARKLGALARELPAALRLQLLEETLGEPGDGLFAQTFGAVNADEGVALIAKNFSMDPGQIARLAHVFQRLVPRQLERMELADQLNAQIHAAGDCADPLADNAWGEVQELLTGESGEFMSRGYQEQLQRLTAREQARRDGEAALAALPELATDLASARLAEESLLIQFEQLVVATGVESYRDALESVGGLCGAALAAGDRGRGLRILRQLSLLNAGDQPLAGPRSDLERTLRAVASVPVLLALIAIGGGLDADDRATVRAFFALVPAAATPALLDALAAEEDPGRRREIVALLEDLGPTALPEMLRRLTVAPPALVRALLPLAAALRDPAAVPVLLGLLGRDDVKMRRDALRALVSIDSPEVSRALPGLLEDEDTEIVQMAAARLGDLDCPDTVRALLGEIEAGFFLGRRAEQMQRAIFILGRMRAAAAVEPLAELLRQRTWINRSVRESISETAVQALARIGGDDAKKVLELAAARGPEALATTCRRLLARWGAA